MSETKLLTPQLIEIDKLVPYDKNAKLHPPDKVAALAKIIRKQGFDQPIVVDRNLVIIKGHGRRLASLELGLKRVPVIVRDDLSDADVKAARLSDNQAASLDYDTELLQFELKELQALDYEMDTLGYDERELDFLIDTLDELEGEALVEDVGEAFDEAREETERKADEMIQIDVPLFKAFGFKAIPSSGERAVQHLISHMEEDTGKVGADALIAYAQRYVA